MEQVPKSLSGLGVQVTPAGTATRKPTSQTQVLPPPKTSPCMGAPRGPTRSAPPNPFWGRLGTHPGSTQPWMSATHECFCSESMVSRMYSAPFSTWGQSGPASSPQHRAADSGANGSPAPPPWGLTGTGSRNDSGVTVRHHLKPGSGAGGRAVAALPAAPPSGTRQQGLLGLRSCPLSSGPRVLQPQPLRKPRWPGTPEMGRNSTPAVRPLKVHSLARGAKGLQRLSAWSPISGAT